MAELEDGDLVTRLAAFIEMLRGDEQFAVAAIALRLAVDQKMQAGASFDDAMAAVMTWMDQWKARDAARRGMLS